MNIRFLSKLGIILGSILAGTFLLFLLLPFVLNFFIDKYTPQIAGEINKITGLSSGLEEVKIVTTPKLTAGLKVKKFELYTPLKEPVLIADNFQLKMSLIPLLTKTVKIDLVKADNIELWLKFNKDCDLDFLKYIPQSENTAEESEVSQNPLPINLSNNLPDIRIGGYKVVFTDGKENYTLSGGETNVTDFIINKSVKIKGSGKFTFKDREQFNYNINLFNKIMPEADLNELLTAQTPTEQESTKVDIIKILRGLYDNKLTADINLDLKTTKDSIDGKAFIDNVSIIDLPKSNADLTFKSNNIIIDSNIYTAKNEVSKLNGKITTGKKPYADINFKSDIEISNLLSIVKKVAIIFDIKDLQTLSASGKLNADFNIKSDTKTVQSSGFLKIPAAKMYYGLYNIGIDNISADIALDNNNINIKNAGFSILSHPLKLYGTLTKDAVADLHLSADKLDLKGLLIACGQAALMKENPVYSGTISLNADIKGKLDKINPVIKLNIQNVDLKNIPADLRLKAPSTIVDITSDGKTFGGNAQSVNIQLINPALKISIPTVKANIKEDVIEIAETPASIEKIKVKVSGKINNYLTEKIGMDFVSTGDIKSALTGDINPVKQTLNLAYATTEKSEIIIPMFDKSKMSFTGKINITGSMMNPMVSGSASVPDISIPEIPVTMKGMDLKFRDTFLHGSGTVQEFTSGGIKAENLSGDFALKGVDFYLNNLKGGSFGGKISGDIVYNLSNAKTSIIFAGSGMNAEKAIEGATGIKKALTGTLGFDTRLKLTVLDYDAMIKSMTGDLNFDIKKGSFGTIGRFEGLLGASNIVSNYLLKNTVASITNATGLATTALFDTLDGKMTFSNGWANLNPIKSAGPSLCYYVTGKYNLLNGSTNVVVLGKLDAPMVAKLGVVGQLTASNIVGDKAANILNILTTPPQGEKTDLIPALTNGSTNYQDFKVNFNGGIESKSSIKSFKWLSTADMTNYDTQTIKETAKSIKESLNKDINTTKEDWNNTVEQKKKEIENAKTEFNKTKTDIKNSVDEIKNLWKSVKEQPSKSATEEAKQEAKTSSTATPQAETKVETTTQPSADSSTTSEPASASEPSSSGE